MLEFGSPFSGLANERKLTDEELIRAMRFLVPAEYEVVQMYMQLAESIDNPFEQAVLTETADEEKGACRRVSEAPVPPGPRRGAALPQGRQRGG